LVCWLEKFLLRAGLVKRGEPFVLPLFVLPGFFKGGFVRTTADRIAVSIGGGECFLVPCAFGSEYYYVAVSQAND
jgi:hypothetical protein